MPLHDATYWQQQFADAMSGYITERYAGDGPVAPSLRYALSGSGKRVRPVVCLLAAAAAGKPSGLAMRAALALEWVHTYSLVHDDLPCMDDDDLRRGRPTVHKVYGEAQALLAGDALLTDAFTLLSEQEPQDPAQAATALALVRELAAAAGGGGMVLGQGLDLFWTAKQGATRQHLDEIHLRKTGQLLGAAAAMGALAGGAAAPDVAAFRLFGQRIGLAFQVLDDLLDESVETGKSQGKDAAAGKLTYLAMMSRADAQRAADELTESAVAALRTTAGSVAPLVDFARELLQRRR